MQQNAIIDGVLLHQIFTIILLSESEIADFASGCNQLIPQLMDLGPISQNGQWAYNSKL